MAKPAVERRSYQQFCGLARTLDVVGERWTLLVVRNLLLGPRRYSDLLAELPGITTNLLAKRLREMEASGLIAHEHLPPPAATHVYKLTDVGAALEPAIMELGRWGSRLMQDGPRRDDTVNPGWGLLSLKRRYRGGMSCVMQLHVGERFFEVVLSPVMMAVQERPAVRPQVSIKCSPQAFRPVFMVGSPVEPFLQRGAITIEGDASQFHAFLAATLPPGATPNKG